MERRANTKLPLLAVTMGDPAGIGPEIAVRAVQRPAVTHRCIPVIVGDADWLARTADAIGIAAPLVPIEEPGDARDSRGAIPVVDLKNVPSDGVSPGRVSAAAGRAAYEYIERAVALAVQGKVHGTVTCPINKEAIHAAGVRHAGHTEIYADLTGATNYAMMLAEDDFRVVHVSTHVSLREACRRVKRRRIADVIRLADTACIELGISSPRIVVAGLNPHCGEGGLFGDEEEHEIRPAVVEAREAGINAVGPVPADTLFPQLRGGLYDIAVVMYHDQGHIPVKLAGFVYDRETQSWADVRGVNITLGLPIIRTSVDHGTAFDQAGAGTASDASLVNALGYAASLAVGRFRGLG